MRPATAHGERSSAIPQTKASKGQSSKPHHPEEHSDKDFSGMWKDWKTERGPALLACLEFVESMARKGLDSEPENHKRVDRDRVLSQALEFVRNSTFSNWLQVCKGKQPSEGPQMQPMPFHDLASSFEERSGQQENEISKLERVVLHAHEDIKELREKLASLSAEQGAAEEAAQVLRKSEQKHTQYIQKLRRDLMSAFDDLKAMEEQKDTFRIQAKNRSVELAELERTMAQQEQRHASAEAEVLAARGQLAELQLNLSKEKKRNAELAAKVAQLEDLLKN
jgi:hypothetical protein